MWKNISEAPIDEPILIRRMIAPNEYSYHIGFFRNNEAFKQLRFNTSVTHNIWLAQHNEFIRIADLD